MNYNQLTCINRTNETNNTATYTFKRPANFEFKAGQFVLIELDIDGTTHQRAYSISSAPFETENFSITVKAIDQGLVSNHLFDNLNIGDNLKISNPMGDFYLDENINQNDNYVLIMAGSGITPMHSIASELLNKNPAQKVQIIYSTQKEDDIIYREELTNLENLQKDYPNLDLHILLTRENNPKYKNQRITTEFLAETLTNLDNTKIYMCGPQMFMDLIQDYLYSINFDLNNLFFEKFQEEYDEIQHQDELNATEQVNIKIGDKNIVANKEAVLSHVLESNGISANVVCNAGVCGACICKIKSGTVTQTRNSILTPDQIDNGMVLSCSSIIETDIEVEI